MIKFQTIQKVAKDMGVNTSHIWTMIKNKDLTAHKKDGYKRTYINVKELNNSIKPIDPKDETIDLDKYLI